MIDPIYFAAADLVLLSRWDFSIVLFAETLGIPLGIML